MYNDVLILANILSDIIQILSHLNFKILKNMRNENELKIC